MLSDRLDASTVNVRDDGCRTLDGKNADRKRGRTGGRQENGVAGPEGGRKGGREDRRETGNEGGRAGGIQGMRKAGQEGGRI